MSMSLQNNQETLKMGPISTDILTLTLNKKCFPPRVLSHWGRIKTFRPIILLCNFDLGIILARQKQENVQNSYCVCTLSLCLTTGAILPHSDKQNNCSYYVPDIYILCSNFGWVHFRLRPAPLKFVSYEVFSNWTSNSFTTGCAKYILKTSLARI
jgi:hypothetical protein